MKALLTTIIVLFSTSALADGWLCQIDEVAIKVFNQTQPEFGTRNAAVMVLSDTRVQYGRKTIAKFNSESTLDNQGALYTARVDLRYNDSGRKGELLLGTKLGHVKSIILDVPFSYSEPVEDGDILEAALTLELRNGDEISGNAECERYLKN